MSINDILAYLPADDEPVVVVVIRDPDSANDVTVYGTEATVIDVDLGHLDLSDREEFLQWAESLYLAADALPVDKPSAVLASRQVYEVIMDVDSHGFADHAAIKAAIASELS